MRKIAAQTDVVFVRLHTDVMRMLDSLVRWDVAADSGTERRTTISRAEEARRCIELMLNSSTDIPGAVDGARHLFLARGRAAESNIGGALRITMSAGTVRELEFEAYKNGVSKQEFVAACVAAAYVKRKDL